MDIEIQPGALKGTVNIPSSKSLCHRAIIAAGLSKGNSNLENILFSKDIEASIDAMVNLGAKIISEGDKLLIEGIGFPELRKSEINCNESGSTLRFLIPIALLQDNKITFTGKNRLKERPLGPYINIFEKKSISYDNKNGLPLTVKGPLQPGEYSLPGDVSSQFISGLLFALPLLKSDSKIVITTELESKGYVDLTLDILNKFGVKVQNNAYQEYSIPGNQSYKSIDYRVEGDFSQAAFWLCAGVLHGEIECKDLNFESFQGDKAILAILKAMGANIVEGTDGVKAYSSKTKGIIIDASGCPDLVPILAVMGALSEGTTEIINAGRLRIKESDRLNAISTELNKLGGKVVEREDSLFITGVETLKGGMVESYNDHRIAMALAIASLKCDNSVIIRDSNCIKKSYPGFFEDFAELGGIIDEWILG
ncbi:MAG: 3-phosphoshikimate 1-carboxyvinyltransferase [Clostridiaceae bacterium]|nr:3-phosphoshikimate 1-carboxyvinyltransferase [Clostridiaceae bacterium]